MTTIKIQPPDKTTPGFFRRTKLAMQLQIRAKTGDPEAIDEMVGFLLPYVIDPADHDDARAALWEASQEQIMQALTAMSRTDGGDIPPKLGGS